MCAVRGTPLQKYKFCAQKSMKTYVAGRKLRYSCARRPMEGGQRPGERDSSYSPKARTYSPKARTYSPKARVGSHEGARFCF